MVLRLLAAGHDVTVWNRSQAAIAPVLQHGARAAVSPAAAAADAQTVMLCLLDGTAVEHVVFGPQGIAGARGASVLVDHSSISPVATRDFAARVSLAYSEGLSDTGELTGRGSPLLRGSITGAGTFLGGILHTLPFLIPNFHAAVIAAAIVVAFELVTLAVLRWRFFGTSFTRSLVAVSAGGAVIAVVGALIGSAG